MYLPQNALMVFSDTSHDSSNSSILEELDSPLQIAGAPCLLILSQIQ